jgi:uncharacterized protein YeaO (DUF488 family)
VIKIRRVYDPPGPDEGERYLVDRLWPRGLKREALNLTGWTREAAPSDNLRKWYGHDPEKWEEFQRRYFAELDHKPEAWQILLGAARRATITLLYSSRETELNNAVALKVYLERHLGKD